MNTNLLMIPGQALSLIPGSSCTITTGEFTNRALDVTGDATLDAVCWGSCLSCSDIITYAVTFSVDMNEVAGPFTTPEVNGSWDGWCGGCTPLSDPDGDGIWSTTKMLEPGYYEYKFAYDSWSGDESLTLAILVQLLQTFSPTDSSTCLMMQIWAWYAGPAVRLVKPLASNKWTFL